MFIPLQHIIDVIEEQLPLHLQEGYDNSGLQIGEPSSSITAALLCVDLTEAVVDEALSLGANLIITHHPPLFKPLKRLVGATYIERALLKAIRSGIAIYSAHSNADNAPMGINHLLAKDLQLENCQVLAPSSMINPQGNESSDLGEQVAGAGIIGDLRAPIDLEEFLQQIKHYFATEKLSYTPTSQRAIQRVALCGGAGSFLIGHARKLGADIFITGEAKYNDYFDAEAHPILVTVGHYESEVIATSLFKSIISAKFPTFALYVSKLNSNPIVSI